MGFDFSVSKCSHSGKIRVSLFNRDNDSKCCCSVNKVNAIRGKICQNVLSNSSVKPIIQESASTGNCKKLPPCCAGKVQKVEKQSCCSKPVKKNESTHIFNDADSNYTDKIPGDNVKAKDCCTHSILSVDISRASVNIETISRLNTVPTYRLPYFELESGICYSNKPESILIDYPLKKPIKYVISFIYLSSAKSDCSDDDSLINFC